jgi:ferritin
MEARVSKKIHEMINAQIAHEQTNSLIYLAISNWADYSGWYGIAEVYKSYAEEEKGHRDIFIKYLLDRNALPKTSAKDERDIPLDFKDVEEILNLTYDTEVKTTELIKKINYQAIEEGDCVTRDFLIEMINEQRQEEQSAINWLDRLEIYKETNSPLILLDQEFKESLK